MHKVVLNRHYRSIITSFLLQHSLLKRFNDLIEESSRETQFLFHFLSAEMQSSALTWTSVAMVTETRKEAKRIRG